VPRLVLVSAPAGFGKTTLIAQWLATGQGDGDSEPASGAVRGVAVARCRSRRHGHPGASSDIGRDAVLHFNELGYRVFAGVRARAGNGYAIISPHSTPRDLATLAVSTCERIFPRPRVKAYQSRIPSILSGSVFALDHEEGAADHSRQL
jgi:hypothetical protein